MTTSSPSTAMWEMGLRLRAARDRAGYAAEEAAAAIPVKPHYLNNVERGRRMLAEDKLATLLELYEPTADEHEELLALRRTFNTRGWWSQYSDVLQDSLLKLYSYEQGAHEIRSYESGLVSGLLQTERYARAVHQGDTANLRPSDVERRTEARMRRQERLFEPDPLHALIVMNEATLWQQVGGSDVLAGQLERLIALMDAETPTIDLRIIPFTGDSYGALGSSTFHLLKFPSPRLTPLVWQESVTSLRLVDDETQLRQYHASFAEALDRAADHDTSRKLIHASLGSIT